MSDEHHVVRFILEAGGPHSRIIVGRKAFSLRDLGPDESGPDLGGLARTRLGRMNDPRRPYAAVLDGVSGDPLDGVGTVVGQVAVGVDVLALRLAVAHEIDAHSLNLWWA